MTLGLSLAGAISIADGLLTQTRKAYAAEVDRSRLSETLNIYNWSDYIAEDTVSNFEKEFGVKVNYDTYEGNEALLAKLQSGATGYDIVVPTGYMVEIMIKQGLLTPITHENIPNLKGVSEALQDPPYDPGRKHTVPWQWGTTGFAYNIQKAKKNNLGMFSRMMKKAQAVRRLGSAALDLCWLAAGRFEGFWEYYLHPWDTAAAILIVSEAGGKVSQIKKNDYSIFDSNILATNNNSIHRAMRRVLTESQKKTK